MRAPGLRMKWCCAAALLGLVLLAGRSPAGPIPIPISGQLNGTFVNPKNGNYVGAGTSFFQFGTPTRSVLGFIADHSFSVKSEQPFSLGVMTFFNADNFNPTTKLTFRVDVALAQPTGIGHVAFDFQTHIDNTPNVHLLPGMNADTVRLNSESSSPGFIGPDHNLYKLELLGFSWGPSWPGAGNLRHDLSAFEHYGTYGFLWAKFVDPPLGPNGEPGGDRPPGVPEPTTLLLFGMGLAAVTLGRRRRK